MTLATLSTIIHIVAGTTTLITGPIALMTNRRRTRSHRLVGMIFFVAMNIVCISAVIGYLKRPNLVFYQFLLGISVFVWAGILRGVRAIKLMHGSRVFWFDYAYTTALGIFSVWMLAQGIKHFKNPDLRIFGILFVVFGISAVGDVIKNIKMFKNWETVHRLEWLRLHSMSMTGAFIASTTAFTVNIGGDVLPWYIQWFGPTIALVPLQIHWSRTFKKEIALAKG